MKAPMHRMLSAATIVVLATVTTDATAQEIRQRMVDNALALPEADERADALIRAIDPNLGPPDSLWIRAVARLVEDLILELDDPNALLWLRWAVRHHPEYSIPAVETEPEVIAALDRVRREMGTIEAADTITTWDWSGAVRSGQGTLRVNPRGLPDDAGVRIMGRGPIAGDVTLAAGTYDVEVVQAGEATARVTRQILPGVVTMLNFNLPALVVTIEPEAAGPTPGQFPAAADGGGGFPVAIAVVGGLGALGAVAALVLGGSSENPQQPPGGPSTGGIIINYPIP